MHTPTWMPGSFFNKIPNGMFPLKIKLIEQYAVVTGSYSGYPEIPTGSIILEINGNPIITVLGKLPQINSADAFNSYFIDAVRKVVFYQFSSPPLNVLQSHTVSMMIWLNRYLWLKIISRGTRLF